MIHYTRTPLAPTFGLTITDVDLSEPVDDETAQGFVDDLTAHRVLVVPGQKLDHAAHLRFSRLFGPLDVYPVAKYVVPEFPEILKISNIFSDGLPIGLYDGDDQEEWHVDYSFKEVMSRASLLYSVIAPLEGGDTLFADTTAAYDDLPAELQERVADLRAVHSMTYLVDTEVAVNPHKAPLTPEERERMPDVEHPLVDVHPVTGRRSLLLGDMIISGIVGLPAAESTELLRVLHEHASADRYVYRHHWSAGDLVIWDNRSLMHTRTACDSRYHHRLLHRTTVL